MILKAKDATDTVMTSSEIALPENATFGNMQMATLTSDSVATANINIEDIDIFKELSLKFRFSSDADFHSIDTDPQELSDLFIVCHYNLGDL